MRETKHDTCEWPGKTVKVSLIPKNSFHAKELDKIFALQNSIDNYQLEQIVSKKYNEKD